MATGIAIIAYGLTNQERLEKELETNLKINLITLYPASIEFLLPVNKRFEKSMNYIQQQARDDEKWQYYWW